MQKYGLELRQTRACLACGDDVEQINGRKEKLYCNDKCRMEYWKNHPESLNKKAYYFFTCLCCGAPFESYGNNKRKYCSRECFFKVRNFKIFVREYKSCKVLMQPTSIKDNTYRLYGETGHQRKPPVHPFFKNARSAEECSKILQTKAEAWAVANGKEASYEDKQLNVHLVCKRRPVGYGADSFVMIITEVLKMNPYSGDIFAFCGKNDNRIKYIYWDGSGFRLISRRQERLKYAWPPENFGGTVDVTMRAFEFLLSGISIPNLMKI